MKPNRTCRDVGAKLTSYLAGELPPDEADAVRRHLEVCRPCRASAEDLAATLDLLRDALAGGVPADATLEPQRLERVRATRPPPAILLWFADHGPALARAASVLALVGVAASAMLWANRPLRRAATRGGLAVAELKVSMVDKDDTLEFPAAPDPAPALAVPRMAAKTPARAETPHDEATDAPRAADGFKVDALFASRKPQSDRLDQRRLEMKGERDEAALAVAQTPPADAWGASREEPAAEIAALGLGTDRSEARRPSTTAAPAAPARIAVPEATAPVLVMKGLYAGRSASGRGPAGGATGSATQPASTSMSAPGMPQEPHGMDLDVVGGKVATRRGDAMEEAESAARATTGESLRRGLEHEGHGGGGGGGWQAGEWADDRRSIDGKAGAGFGDIALKTPGARPLREGDVADESIRLRASAVEKAGERAKVESEDKSFLVSRLQAAKDGNRLTVDGDDESKHEAKPDLAADLDGRLGERGAEAAVPGAEAQPKPSAPHPALPAAPTKPVPEEIPTDPIFEPAGVNPFVETATNAFSTFAIDVDTASYAIARRYIVEGRRPPPEAVRTEEFVNAFDYDDAPPASGVFAIHVEAAPSPFRPSLTLLKIGVKARRIGRDEGRAATLTLVVDTSGSMDTPDRLGRIRASLRKLVEHLDPADTVALVAFANQARLALEPTPAARRDEILAAIDGLTASGSTHLEGGLRLGYETAARGFRPGASNRVLLFSDGVANLGAAEAGEILKAVETFRRQGLYASVFGFGTGAYNDVLLERLADRGDGQYVFIDSDAEAERVLVGEMAATLHTVARDAKIQVEFDPARVARFRQIGYENRRLEREQFRDDAVDAGEVGSGQSVTALYELQLAPAPERGRSTAPPPLATVRVRYRDVETGRIEEIEQPVTAAHVRGAFEEASARFGLAAGVAEFAEMLRGSPYAAGTDPRELADALRRAAAALPLDGQAAEAARLAQASAAWFERR
jgi:Ca-activated chloride channel family protein